MTKQLPEEFQHYIRAERYERAVKWAAKKWQAKSFAGCEASKAAWLKELDRAERIWSEPV